MYLGRAHYGRSGNNQLQHHKCRDSATLRSLRTSESHKDVNQVVRKGCTENPKRVRTLGLREFP